MEGEDDPSSLLDGELHQPGHVSHGHLLARNAPEVVQIDIEGVVEERVLARGPGRDEVLGHHRDVALAGQAFAHVGLVAGVGEGLGRVVGKRFAQPLLGREDVRLDVRQRRGLQAPSVPVQSKVPGACVAQRVVADLVAAFRYVPPQGQALQVVVTPGRDVERASESVPVKHRNAAPQLTVRPVVEGQRHGSAATVRPHCVGTVCLRHSDLPCVLPRPRTGRTAATSPVTRARRTCDKGTRHCRLCNGPFVVPPNTSPPCPSRVIDVPAAGSKVLIVPQLPSVAPGPGPSGPGGQAQSRWRVRNAGCTTGRLGADRRHG